MTLSFLNYHHLDLQSSLIVIVNRLFSKEFFKRRSSRTVAGTTRTVERPDGRTVEIRGAFHARLTGRNGHQVVVEHPVISSIEGRTLIVRGSNVAPQTIPMPNLSSVEIGQTNKGAVAVGYSLLGVVLAVVASVIVVKVL